MQVGNVSVMTAVAGDSQNRGTHTNLKKNYHNSASSGIGEASNDKPKVPVDMLNGLTDMMKMEENELAGCNTTGLLVVDLGGNRVR